MATYSVNGTAVRAPNGCKVELQPITDAQRLESGKMDIRGVAPKIKVTWIYNYITQKDLAKILGESWEEFVSSKNMVSTVVTPLYDGSKTISAYFAPLTYEILMMDENNPEYNIYSNFEISWIEV